MRIVARLGLSGLILGSAAASSQPAPSQSPVKSPASAESSVSSTAGEGEADATDRIIEEKCPGARDRQRQRGVPYLMRAVAEPTRPALRPELVSMMERDQSARTLTMANVHSTANPRLGSVTEIDAANLQRLKHIVAQDGFPTRSMVGDDGVNAAWLLTQHADSDLRRAPS